MNVVEFLFSRLQQLKVFVAEQLKSESEKAGHLKVEEGELPVKTPPHRREDLLVNEECRFVQSKIACSLHQDQRIVNR